jgi:hypothetical protein
VALTRDLKTELLAGALAFDATIVAMPGATADDAVQRGGQLARIQCASCHMIAPHQREELADAPPFEIIARKASFDSDQLINLLAFTLNVPRPRHNPQHTKAASEPTGSSLIR